MTNRNQKGWRAENEVRKILEKLGYLVWKPTRTKFSSIDIFGLFDMIAVHPSYRMLWVQVKHKSSMSKKVKKDFETFYNKYIHPSNLCELTIWVRERGGAFVIHSLSEGIWKEKRVRVQKK